MAVPLWLMFLMAIFVAIGIFVWSWIIFGCVKRRLLRAKGIVVKGSVIGKNIRHNKGRAYYYVRVRFVSGGPRGQEQPNNGNSNTNNDHDNDNDNQNITIDTATADSQQTATATATATATNDATPGDTQTVVYLSFVCTQRERVPERYFNACQNKDIVDILYYPNYPSINGIGSQVKNPSVCPLGIYIVFFGIWATLSCIVTIIAFPFPYFFGVFGIAIFYNLLLRCLLRNSCLQSCVWGWTKRPAEQNEK